MTMVIFVPSTNRHPIKPMFSVRGVIFQSQQKNGILRASQAETTPQRTPRDEALSKVY